MAASDRAPVIRLTLPLRLSNLSLRLIAAIVALPVLIGATHLGGWVFPALVLAASLLAAWEFGRLAEATGTAVAKPVLIAGTGLLVVSGHQLVAPALTVLLLAALMWSLYRFRRGGTGTDWLWTVGGALYTGWLPGHFVTLRAEERGLEWVLVALCSTVISDTAAYAVGRAAGRCKLAPLVSPGKTWEGAIGGLVFTTLLTPALAWLLHLPGGPLLWVLGFAISVFAQAGDLVESMLKRTAGVKDAGRLVPGHGGILDRMDSLVFVGPLVYYYVRWLISAP
ncbi:MAG: phosphatidate cytidylyltransferase [Dehalococcoidia bacterium]|nr:phosphatidate cytidylyltransferase [Dehalococcoidia bacterium]